MRFLAAVVPLLCAAFLLPLIAGAVEMPTSVVAAGGERSSSTNYVHLGTLGQSGIGIAAGPSKIIRIEGKISRAMGKIILMGAR